MATRIALPPGRLEYAKAYKFYDFGRPTLVSAYAEARQQFVLGRLQLAAADGTLGEAGLETVNAWLS